MSGVIGWKMPPEVDATAHCSEHSSEEMLGEPAMTALTSSPA